MLSRLDAMFDPSRDFRARLVDLVISDYMAAYVGTEQRRKWNLAHDSGDGPRRLWMMFLPRVLLNPSLHAVILIRLMTASPRWMLGFWRTVLIAKHTIEAHWRMEIGPGLLLPHPYGITLPWGFTAGKNLTLAQNITIGARRPRQGSDRITPLFGDDVIAFMDSRILGDIEVGDRAVIGAGTWVEEDVPADEVVRRLPKDEPAATS
jgi:serine O-acetyltransferase